MDKEVKDLLKALDSLADAAADFGQCFGAENEGRDADNHDDLWHSKPENAVTGESPFLSSRGPIQSEPGPGPVVDIAVEE